ncbi:hypothetical protein [Terriglobus sp.]|uniref:hypothetical protein n=1 Tax=Terriglobus sp. TaxID=1889013 RepID=UPI003B0093B6
MADSLHSSDSALAEQFLRAAERCREANREFVDVLHHLKPSTAAGEQARAQLLQQLTEMDCGDKLLHSMLDGSGLQQSEIHPQTPPNQVH